MIQAFHLVMGLCTFAVGAVIGSFINVCVYRIPWEKSVIWPASHCPRCLRPIAAQDNVPVLSWIMLRGECRTCGGRIAPRYALIEALTGLLFVGAYVTDVVYAPMGVGTIDMFLRMGYHQLLIAFLLAATFIDYDLQIIPDQITVTGMVLGVALGAIAPDVRPDPSSAGSPWEGLMVGGTGLLVGGGLTWAFRAVFSFAFGREALGFGDVTLMALIGSFLGWQAAVLAFFLGPFFGLFHAGWKLVRWLGKLLRRQPASSADRELAFGPYLSMAAVALVLTWPWQWSGWAGELFSNLGAVVSLLMGGEL